MDFGFFFLIRSSVDGQATAPARFEEGAAWVEPGQFKLAAHSAVVSHLYWASRLKDPANLRLREGFQVACRGLFVLIQPCPFRGSGRAVFFFTTISRDTITFQAFLFLSKEESKNAKNKD